MTRNIRFRTVSVISAIMVLAAAAGAPARAQLKQGDRFDDWTVRCETPKDTAQPSRCYIAQQILVKDNNRPILLFGVGLLGENKRPAAILTVPLGVFLPAGLTLTVPNAKPVRLAFESCMTNGCRAALALEGELLEGMRKGDKAQVTLMDGRRRQINLPVSLKGFTRGFAAVQNQ